MQPITGGELMIHRSCWRSMVHRCGLFIAKLSPATVLPVLSLIW